MTGSPHILRMLSSWGFRRSSCVYLRTSGLNRSRIIECNYANPLEINGLCPMAQRETGQEETSPRGLILLHREACKGRSGAFAQINGRVVGEAGGYF